jgi:hypothetical protein
MGRRRTTQPNLLGILYAGPQLGISGELEPRPIPTNHSSVPVTSIPINLGYVISADVLDDLETIVRAQHFASGVPPTEFSG